MSIRALLLALSLISACGDPIADDVAAYHSQMDSLMKQNTAIANKFLGMAKSIHKDKEEASVVAAKLEKEVVPLADELAVSIKQVSTQIEQLNDIHQQAVSAWELQAKAYHDLSKGYADADLETFNKGQKNLSQAKLTIEGYVRQINQAMQPYGYYIDEFPQAR